MSKMYFLMLQIFFTNLVSKRCIIFPSYAVDKVRRLNILPGILPETSDISQRRNLQLYIICNGEIKRNAI